MKQQKRLREPESFGVVGGGNMYNQVGNLENLENCWEFVLGVKCFGIRTILWDITNSCQWNMWDGYLIQLTCRITWWRRWFVNLLCCAFILYFLLSFPWEKKTNSGGTDIWFIESKLKGWTLASCDMVKIISRVIFQGLPRTWDPLLASGSHTIPISLGILEWEWYGNSMGHKGSHYWGSLKISLIICREWQS